MDSPHPILSYTLSHEMHSSISVPFSSPSKTCSISNPEDYHITTIGDIWSVTNNRQAVFSPWIFGIELKWNLNLFGIVPSGTYQWNFIPYDNKKIFLHAIYKRTPCKTQLRQGIIDLSLYPLIYVNCTCFVFYLKALYQRVPNRHTGLKICLKLFIFNT